MLQRRNRNENSPPLLDDDMDWDRDASMDALSRIADQIHRIEMIFPPPREFQLFESSKFPNGVF